MNGDGVPFVFITPRGGADFCVYAMLIGTGDAIFRCWCTCAVQAVVAVAAPENLTRYRGRFPPQECGGTGPRRKNAAAQNQNAAAQDRVAANPAALAAAAGNRG